MGFDWFLSAISIAISLGFLVFAVIVKNTVGTWMNPSTIFSGLWFLYSFFPLVLGWGVPINPAAVLFLLIFQLFFSSSVIFFPWKKAFDLNNRKRSADAVFNNRFFFYSLGLVSIVTIIFLFLDLQAQGFAAMDDLLGISSQYAGARYSQTLERTVYVKFATVLSFPCVALAGLICFSDISSIRRIAVIGFGFMPSTFLILFQGAKGSLFLSAALFLGSYFVVQIFNKNIFLFSRRFITNTLVAVMVFAVLAAISFAIRSGQGGMQDIESLISSLKYSFLSYSSGHLFAFSDWFSDRYFNESYNRFSQDEWSLGFYTFMSVYQLLGDDRFVPLGIYDEFFDYNGILSTNIYTIFRGLITDFSFFGALIFAFVWGLVSNASFFNLLRSRFSPFAVAFYIFSVAILYQTYIISSLTWLSIPASFFVLFALLFFGERYASRFR